MSARKPTPFDRIFDALATRLDCPVVTDRDADPSVAKRIVLSRAGAPKWGPIPYRREGEQTIGRFAHPWTAVLHGATDLDVCELLEQFTGHVDNICGPPQGCDLLGREGYALEPGEVVMVGGDGAAEAYACSVKLTLYRPTASYIYSDAQATTATLSLTPTAPAALTGTPIEVQVTEA